MNRGAGSRSAGGLGPAKDPVVPAAVEAARRAHALRPDDPAALFRLACLLLRAGDREAGALLPRLERHPGFGPGWREVGETMLELGRGEAALAAAARALRAQPGVAGGYHLLGRVLRQAGRDDEAEQAFEQGLACDPGHADGCYSLALLRQDRGNAGGAAALYRAALTARPDFHEAALNLGVALGDCGRLEEALEAYALALRLRPEAFGRIAQSLVSGRCGLLFLDPGRLRAELVGRAGEVVARA